MILYNVTINVEDDIHDEWLDWMKAVHIPQVLNTGLFQGYRMFKVLSRFDEETGTTYSIQYYLDTMEDYEKYQREHAPGLQKQTADKYKDKFMAFRTILEEL